ncbi:hypothetical protein LshimejAT787_0305010 [Lyophyllum shimeji]|uniref:Uncharacterized protein n=1 Tax=Lyophyllum shimeji TaxID=47721 RepID=A0A9P3PIS8_LYOSH|nr:hypothetical protein LshimejAT787_0305010 [Lyophyllum shimeji]
MASPYSYPSPSEPSLLYPSSPSASSHSSTDSSLYSSNALPAYGPPTPTDPCAYPPPYSPVDDTSDFSHKPRPHDPTPRVNIAHPYARLYAKKEQVKRRKIWNHALEKSLFSPYEISTVGAPQRRKIYIASLEAHVDKLHSQLLEIGFWPVAFEELEPHRGLNSKTAKSMVSGLQHDASLAKLKLLELERANKGLKHALQEVALPETFFAPPPTTHYNYFPS